jgi:hypothetical protein
MISHKDYLFFYHQLMEKNRASVFLQENAIFAEMEKGALDVSIKIAALEEVSPDFRSLFQGSFRWQDKGAYLWVDPKNSLVYLKQKVVFLQRYLPFKYLMQDFISIATEWRELLLCK